MKGVALLFPGQGSQYVGMGRDLADAHPGVAELYREADEILGIPLSRLSWEGPEEDLTATENAQPAILLHSYATWTVIREAIPVVAAAAGHSLGEFSAHLVAGTFGFEDALRIVRRRGELMAASGSTRPGTMAAVMGLEREAIDRVCEEVGEGVVVAANLNAPGQIVISGDRAAVKAASERASEAGARRVLPLNVSGAFHSPLMEVAADGLGEALDAARLADPSFPVVANASAEPVTTADDARTTLLAQLTSPVRWIECMERIASHEPTRWIEVGPGRVLTGLLRRIDRDAAGLAIGDPASAASFLGENGRS